jgi:hypothetical protein
MSQQVPWLTAVAETELPEESTVSVRFPLSQYLSQVRGGGWVPVTCASKLVVSPRARVAVPGFTLSVTGCSGATVTVVPPSVPPEDPGSHASPEIDSNTMQRHSESRRFMAHPPRSRSVSME